MIAWRRLEESDFPLLRSWLEQPHVARWWHHETTAEALARDFGPAARGEEPAEDFLVLLDDRPVGLVQRCVLDDYPDYRTELTGLTAVPHGTATLDYLIGDPKDTGRGIGPAVIRWAVERTWSGCPAVPCVLVPVAAGNRPSWRALEKAGFCRVAEGDLEPDNPIDGPLHYVYRVDRPERP
ncbi:GNAT family N-acetyltransferase [Streptomyces sp. G45]|uniref:GNAT family N-acetyltransferase n=1 Tax=Streptomyces sp. G45 TaxID=3406627 RepID=UPI003C1EFA3E